MARLRGGPAGKVVAISASAVGATIAPAAPCTTRAASSHAGVVANPPASDAAENSTRPATNIRRRPSRSPARPPSSSSPPKARAYALIDPLQAAAGEPERAWMCGSATLTMVASSTTTSCAVAMTSSARPGRRPAPGAGCAGYGKCGCHDPRCCRPGGRPVVGHRGRLLAAQRGLGGPRGYSAGSSRKWVRRADAPAGPVRVRSGNAHGSGLAAVLRGRLARLRRRHGRGVPHVAAAPPRGGAARGRGRAHPRRDRPAPGGRGAPADRP